MNEAGARPLMADHAFSQDAHLQQNGVAIAVGRGRNHFEPVAGFSSVIQLSYPATTSPPA